MKRSRVVMLFWLVVSLSACSKNGGIESSTHVDADPGVNVGNGRSPEDNEKAYVSAFKFKIRYHKDLSLDESEDRKAVQIDNRVLLTDGLEQSVIKFRVFEPGKDYVKFSASPELNVHLSPLKKFAEKELPLETFKEIAFPGAKGVYYENRSTGKLVSRYYILTTEFLLIQIDLQAFAGGNGLAYVAPIVNTFIADLTPPVLKGLKMASLEAGKKSELWFQATDDYSGVMEHIGSCWNFGLRNASGLEVAYFSACGTVIARGGDWYSVSVEVNQYRPSGEYVLDYIYLRDRAGNGANFRIDTTTQTYSDGSGKNSNVPVLKVDLVNSNRNDVTAPILKALRMDPLEAGKTGELWFQATDDYSGVSDHIGSCWNFGLRNVSGVEVAYFPACGSVAARGGDWYSVSVEINQYRPSGEYVLDYIYLRDKAGNAANYRINTVTQTYSNSNGKDSNIPALKVDLVNSNRIDVAAPVLKALKMGPLEAGKSGELWFQATDDYSGVMDHIGSCWNFGLRNASGVEVAYFSACGSVTARSGDWYSIPVEINQYKPAGEYVLDSIYLRDKAGNTANYRINIGTQNYSDDSGKNSGVPVLKTWLIK